MDDFKNILSIIYKKFNSWFQRNLTHIQNWNYPIKNGFKY